ncbi:MAG TPA: hydrogenobyrinic acid a,c-diamide synthase (glutamine-hydrolyzing), partial [Methanosarcinales archaeon]|nr:hydrogenobyrinic acid a,c-diamide synthase (glutamine-hydrolyzing) [Methanosarcinales archaeon]
MTQKNSTKVDSPRILLAGDRSSSGKTTISVGLMSILHDIGYKVQPFKVGLDYIDPSYHTEITNRPSRNLDGYLMSKSAILEVYNNASKGADLSIIEGVRGLFEGFESLSDLGSTAQIAKILKCPVILIIDARSITRSAAAIVKGYKEFDKEVNIAGVILNNIGSRRHADKARTAIETYANIKVLGAIPRRESMALTMRHLGLIPALEGRRKVSDFQERLKEIKKIIKENIDLEYLLSSAESAPKLEVHEPKLFIRDLKKDIKIGIALDEAFNFYYRDTIDLLE